MKKAFVTGSNGFLGVNLIGELCREGWGVTAFHLPGEDLKYLKQFDIQTAAGDILDYQSLLDALSEPDSHRDEDLDDTIIFHLAGDTSMWHRNDKRQVEINVLGTKNVCRAALEKQVKRLVFTSSSSAFGYHAGRINEDTPSNALSCRMNYNRTKFLAEKEIRTAMRQGLDAVILNPCNIMGPYDATGWSTLISSIARGKAPGVTTGIGTFAHVKDIARAHIAAAERGRAGENYLLGGVEMSFKEISEQINGVLGKTVPLKALSPALLRFVTYLMQLKSIFDGKEPLLTYPRYKRLTGRLLCDDSKARAELGFSTTDMGTMIRDSYVWLKQEKLIEGAESLKVGATEFVDVDREPLHKELLSNSHFRVYRALLTPGRETEYHRHLRNTLYIVCKGGRINTKLLSGSAACPNILPKGLSWKLKLKLLIGKIVTGNLDLPAGFLFYMPSRDFPVVHKASASGNNMGDMDLLGIEIMQGNAGCPTKTDNHLGGSVIDTDDAAVYRLSLEPDQKNRELLCEAPCLVVSISAFAEVETNGSSLRIAPGECRYFDSGSVLNISNLRNTGNDLVLIQSV